MQEISKIVEVKFSISYLQDYDNRTNIRCSDHFKRFILPYYQDYLETKEVFFASFLNRAGQIIGLYKVSEGGCSGTVVDIKQLFMAGIHLNATGIIISHNHPSGNPKPSASDIEITRKIKEAARFLDMNLLDHIIITKNSYLSLLDEGHI